MNYQEFPPSPRFARLIKCYWTLDDNSSEQECPEPILPDGCPEIVFNFSEPIQRHHGSEVEIQPSAIVVGQMETSVVIEPTLPISLFGVRFHPHGLYHLIKQPLHELTNRIEEVGAVFGQIGRELEERINNSKNIDERIVLFENLFSRSVEEYVEKENFSEIAGGIIYECNGSIKIDDLAEALKTNSKMIERRFLREIGITPKRLCRIARFQETARLISVSGVRNWADLAVDAGYFDQSHFIKEFKKYSGLTPTRLVERTLHLTDFFVKK
jgi:AraC-like DNA-binding protein